VDPTPLSCPSCGGSKLVARGYGNRAVASALQAIFPETTVECVEKGSLPGTAPRPDILLATRHYIENIFDPFDPEAFGLVTELDADRPLYEPSTFAVERAVIGSHEWMGVANACRADVLFQTEAVELTREILAHPEQVVAGDIETRRSYGQPPFSRSVDARYTSDEPLKRSQALHILADQIRQAVPRARLSESEELHISVPLEDEAPLLDVLLRFDDRYIIDTRPIG
jgi:primosomal protein N'